MRQASRLFLSFLLCLSGVAGAEETRYVFLMSGNRAGSLGVRDNGREVETTFEFNDRGRGPKFSGRTVYGDGGLPESVEIQGTDYWKKPLEERFQSKDGKAVWSNGAEHGESTGRRAFYVTLNRTADFTAHLATALLDAPGRRLDLLPAGEARIEPVGSLEVQAGDAAHSPRTPWKVDLYAITGLNFVPTYVWLDPDRKLFAVHEGWVSIVREGWEDVVPRLVETQDAAGARRDQALAAKLTRRPAGALAVTGARLFDPETGKVTSGTTVVVAANRIQAVGKDGEVQVPAGAEVIDARGRMLLPGLWDMHAHLDPVHGLLNLAAGVTTARDMANDIDQLLAMKKSWEKGETIGTRVIMAGFMDGPGPYAGPSKVLVSTQAEALAAVDRYASLGYEQIKLYSSLPPELVPAIAERTHKLGLRLSGHIPNGLTAEQAVRAGFDEIQHVNFLFLNFIPGVDTRTPARFTEVAAHAAELDLGSAPVQGFLKLLKERGTVSDPTLAAFEDMILGRPGEVSPTYAAVADRLPSQVRRDLLSGGLAPPAGMEQRYRDSFRAMLRMVKALHDAGIPIVAGTDALPGFALHRELELYAEAGLPAPEILRIATLGAARVMKHDKELGTVAPGKLADFILVDGDPTARIGDIRRVVLTVKDGLLFDPAALYAAIGVKPAV